jgi:hypothetical protein
VSRECGWEEKVSIWKGSLSDQDCEIGEYRWFWSDSWMLVLIQA